jgi:hypothetical protein
MEVNNLNVSPPPRVSDKRIIRQASYSLVFIALLAAISFAAYSFGVKNNHTQVLGTETITTPTPYPTLPPIPTLFPTTPTPTLTPSPTPKIQITIKPLLKNPHIFQLVTPTPIPTPISLQKIQKSVQNIPSL